MPPPNLDRVLGIVDSGPGGRCATVSEEMINRTAYNQPRTTMNRRSFFTAAAGLGTTMALGAGQPDNTPAPAPKKRINTGRWGTIDDFDFDV